MADSLQPNYLTIDAEGNIGASFAGAIVASSLTIQGPVTGLLASMINGQLTAGQIAAVNAAAISGQLTAAQIAAVSAAVITGTIGSTQIADGAITTPLLAANAVVAAAIAANAIDGSKIEIPVNNTATVPPTPPPVPIPEDRLTFHSDNAGDGAGDRADIFTSFIDTSGGAGTGPFQTALQLQAYASSASDQSNVKLYAMDDGANAMADIGVTYDAASGISKAYADAGGHTVTLVDSNGETSFLNLLQPGSYSIQYGFVSFSAAAQTWIGVAWSYPTALSSGAYAIYSVYVTSGINSAIYHELVNVSLNYAQVNLYCNVAVGGYVYFVIIGD